MIVGILLAAGAGSRFGGDKLLARLPDGRSVAETACAQLREGVDQVIAVVRPDADELAAHLQATGATVQRFADAHLGMGASLAFGVGCVPDAEGWLIALADMPLIESGDITRVADAVRNGAAIAVPDCHGRRGHPVGFAHRLGAELCALTGDSGARSIVARHADEVLAVTVENTQGWLDIDTPQDWSTVCNVMSQASECPLDKITAFDTSV